VPVSFTSVTGGTSKGVAALFNTVTGTSIESLEATGFNKPGLIYISTTQLGVVYLSATQDRTFLITT
jgi:hypothetical protein